MKVARNSLTWATIRTANGSSRATGRFHLAKIVIVLDNAPAHSGVGKVFEKPAYSDATLLSLGPYSPMLNAIENCFLAFKSAVKRHLPPRRREFLRTPAGVTEKEHRQSFKIQAAALLMPDNTRAVL